MAKPFAGISAKLERCSPLLRELMAERTRFLSSDSYGTHIDYESEPGYMLIKAFALNEPPPVFGVLIGELLYHCRSCLDHLACELTELNNRPVDDDVEFPIFDNPNKFRNKVTGDLMDGIKKRIGGIESTRQAIIEREQPFNRYNGHPHDDPLWHLYKLSNFDRHQALHIGQAFIVGSDVRVTFDPPFMRSRFILVGQSYPFLEGEAEVARYRILPRPGDPDVNVNAEVPFNVAFGKPGPVAGRPMFEILSALGVRMATLINLLGR